MKCELCGKSVEQTEPFVVAGLDGNGKVIKKATMEKNVCKDCAESLKGQLDNIVSTLRSR